LKMGIELIVGIGIVLFLLIYFAFAWDKKEHYLLQLLAAFFFIGLLILIPKSLIDDQDNCEIVIANETVVGNSTDYNTTYEYKEFCITEDKATASIFFISISWFMRIFYTYIFLYFVYVIYLKKLIKKYKMKRGKDD